CLNGLGTNAGLKRMASAQHGASYRDLLYVRRRYVTVEQLREAVAVVTDATLRVRDRLIWGEGTNACASDSKHFGAWDQSLTTQLKAIHSQRLYRPDAGQPGAYPDLQLVLSKPIDWDLIRHQYDEMVKHATALRPGTAEAEAILRRFTRENAQHPTYKALLE